jgi:mutual gliding-motility protein MglA
VVQINFAHKEIQCKVVYYGPGMSGKTTNLELVHEKTPGDSRGELTSIATTGERTLYFDYMPLDLGSIAGIKTKFQLYTVPGQIYYKSTRRLVLQGVDGIVFVADSSASKLEENRESMRDLEENLKEMGRAVSDLPIVIQYNKRDLPDAMTIEELQKQVNVHNFPYHEAIAKTGQGIFPTLKALASMVLEAVNRGGIGATRAPKPATAAAPAPAPVAAAAPSASRPTPAHAASPAYATPSRPTQPLHDVGSRHGAPATGHSAPSYAPRTAIAASAPSSAIAGTATLETEASACATAVAAPAPLVGRTPPAPAPQASATSAASGASAANKLNADRYVKVSGLGRASGGGRAKWIGILVVLIGVAAWFVLTKLGK